MEDLEEDLEETTSMQEAGYGYGDALDPVAVVDKSVIEPPPEPLQVPETIAEEPPLEKELVLLGANKVLVFGFLRGFLERLKLLDVLPGAKSCGDTSIRMEKINDGYEIVKAKLLESAKLVLRPFQRGPKPSKFAIETAWLMEVISATLKEVELEGTFSILVKAIEEGEARENRLPESIEHIKVLNLEMHQMRATLFSEAEEHKMMVRQWNKNLAALRQGIKDLKKQNKIAAKYRADILAAQTDSAKRVRDVRINDLKHENEELKRQIKIEKHVNSRNLEFLKKQSVQLMEEAISLQAGHETDIQEMDLMIKKLLDQKKEKEEVIAELEPQYLQEMAEIAAIEAELEKQKNISIEQQGENEMRLRATMRIQRIWRGRVARKAFKKELRKWRKKHKKEKKGGKKKKK